MTRGCVLSLQTTVTQMSAGWLILTVFLSFHQASSAWKFSGAPNTYVKLQPWEPCLNGSLKLNFTTGSHSKAAILLYLNRGIYSYFELKLSGGGVQLRMDLGGKVVFMKHGEYKRQVCVSVVLTRICHGCQNWAHSGSD